jgi:hypothetical protein
LSYSAFMLFNRPEYHAENILDNLITCQRVKSLDGTGQR